MVPITLEKTYSVHSFLINPAKRLHLVGLLGFLQDIAAEHANILGFGYDDMVRSQSFWVLVRQKLVIDHWPHWNDKVRIRTTPILPDGMYAYREFEIYLGEKQIGSCSTTWMVLDANTRRPKQVTFKNEVTEQLKGFQLSFQAQKIHLPKVWEHTHKETVQYGDLDMNMHVNNLRYSQWVLNAVPLDIHENLQISSYEINFLGECFQGDSVICSHAVYSENDTKELYFKGVLEEQHKNVFSAKLVTN